jgi:hypothetical protein
MHLADIENFPNMTKETRLNVIMHSQIFSFQSKSSHIKTTKFSVRNSVSLLAMEICCWYNMKATMHKSLKGYIQFF